MEKPEGYPEVVTEDQAMPSSSCFSGMKDDMSLLESGLLGKCCRLKARIRVITVFNPNMGSCRI